MSEGDRPPPDPQQGPYGQPPGQGQQPPPGHGQVPPGGQYGYWQQGPPPPGYGQPPVSPQDERTWALFAHLGGMLVSIVVPLVIYLVYKDRSPFLNRHGAQALNFQLTLLIAWVAGSVLTAVFVGIIVLLAAAVVNIVFGILATMAASRGEDYVYPVAIPFIKS